jgi:hypothetical protein
MQRASDGPPANESRRLTALPALPPEMRSDSTLCMYDNTAAAPRARSQLETHHEKAESESPSLDKKNSTSCGLGLLSCMKRTNRMPTQRIKWLRALLLCLLACCVTMAASVLDVSMRTATEEFRAPVHVSLCTTDVSLCLY